ncbi:MAG TPA: hypothetical protein ENK12_03320, partial [Gammaproteobacteria bacterium]|nr:hypothetical protein [Gammaproteobacteria bacterium]
MHFARDDFNSELLVRAWSPGELRVGDRRYRRNLVLTTERVIEDWAPQCFEDLDAACLDALAELEPEVVLIGTGETLRFPAPACTAGLLSRGVGVEVMDTGAACRTFNILLSEGRRVVAALLLR